MIATERSLAGLALPRERTSFTLTDGYPPNVTRYRAKDAHAALAVTGKHAAGVIGHALMGDVVAQAPGIAAWDVLATPESAASHDCR